MLMFVLNMIKQLLVVVVKHMHEHENNYPN